MKVIWLVVIIFLVFVFLLPGVLGLGIHKIPSGFQPPLSNSQQLAGQEYISQSFTAVNNRLSGFALTIKNPNLANKEDIKMILSQNNQVLREVTLSGKNIPDGGFMNFSFDPIENSQNQTYSVTFMAPNATPDKALELYHSDQTYPGVYAVDGGSKPGSLSFITYYVPANALANLLIIYRNWFWKFFQDPFFALVYFVLIIGFTTFLILHRKGFN